MTPAEVTARVQQALELSKSPNTQLVCKNTVAPETENITTDIQVCFAEDSLNGEIDISHLMQDLSTDASIGALTLQGPPEPRVAIHGSFGTKLFKILLNFSRAASPEPRIP